MHSKIVGSNPKDYEEYFTVNMTVAGNETTSTDNKVDINFMRNLDSSKLNYPSKTLGIGDSQIVPMNSWMFFIVTFNCFKSTQTTPAYEVYEHRYYLTEEREDVELEVEEPVRFYLATSEIRGNSI